MYSLENATTNIDIDEYFVSFESGLPQMSYKMYDRNSHGGLVTGSGALAGRIVRISRSFVKTDFTGRQTFLNWFTKPNYEEIYLRWTTTNSYEGLSRVYPMLQGGESFQVRNFNYSKEVGFEMLMPDPYFTSTSLTTTTIDITSTALQTTSITISGGINFPYYEFTSTHSWSDFDLKISNNYGFHVDFFCNADDVLKIVTSDSELKMYVNDILLTGYFSALSTPFELQNGVNPLYIRGSSGTLSIKYYERRL